MNNSKELNVLIIDPWFLEYTQGLCECIQKEVNLEIVSSYENEKKYNKEFKIYPFYFKYSVQIKNRYLMKILKGLEYAGACIKTLVLIFRNKYDIVHIQWLLFYPVDVFFLNIMSKMNTKIVYTAHNAVPHIKKDSLYIQCLNQIYKKVDFILVHGKEIRDELFSCFSIPNEKVIIQKFGFYTKHKNTDTSMNEEEQGFLSKVKEYKGKKVVYIGNIFRNKGVDRLFKFWINHSREFPNDCMIICGSLDEKYCNFDNLANQFSSLKNALYLPKRFSEGFHNSLLANADIILLPYRHASMSGVVFTAAQFSKMIISTNTGAIGEYIENCPGALLVDNTFKGFESALLNIFFYSKEELIEKGQEFSVYMSKNYSWDVVSKDVENIYQRVIENENTSIQ